MINHSSKTIKDQVEYILGSDCLLLNPDYCKEGITFDLKISDRVFQPLLEVKDGIPVLIFEGEKEEGYPHYYYINASTSLEEIVVQELIRRGLSSNSEAISKEAREFILILSALLLVAEIELMRLIQ